MEFYNKINIENLKKEAQPYYIPDLLFDGGDYKMVRLEVKWAYVACLNVLLKSPLYDNEGNAYFKNDNPMLVDMLAKLANKKVDNDKIQGYLNELEDKELLEIHSHNVYLKKIEHIF